MNKRLISLSLNIVLDIPDSVPFLIEDEEAFGLEFVEQLKKVSNVENVHLSDMSCDEIALNQETVSAPVSPADSTSRSSGIGGAEWSDSGRKLGGES